jgi:hypothetical protein
VIAFVDAFSKFVIAEPLRTHTAEDWVDVFMTRIVSVFGLPEELVSDGAPEFRSRLQEQLLRAAGITRKIVTAYRPQANGQVERFFRTLRPMLATLAHLKPRSWDLILPHAIGAYNTAYNAVIGNTPFYLMFGRDPFSWRHETLMPLPNDEDFDVNLRIKRVQIAREWARLVLLEQQRENRTRYDERAHLSVIGEGDVVMVKIPNPSGVVRKLAPKYAGPYRVRKVLGSILCVVPVAFPNQPERRVHQDRTRFCEASRLINANLDELSKPWGVGAADIDPNIESEQD